MDSEAQQALEEPSEIEIVIEVLPTVEDDSFLYVCSECGNDLTKILQYNRFYCENCLLHY